MCRKCLGVLHLQGELLAPKAASCAASLDQTELFKVHLTFFFLRSHESWYQVSFPIGPSHWPPPESARGESSVGKAQGPGPRSEGCGERMEAWMLGTDNRKLLHTLSIFVAILFFLLIFSWVFPRILSFASKTSAVIPHFSSPYKASHLWCTVQNDPSHAMEVTSHSYQCFSVQLWHSWSSLWSLILRMIQNYLSKNTQCLASLRE